MVFVLCYFQDPVTYLLVSASGDGDDYFYLDKVSGDIKIRRPLGGALKDPNTYTVSTF